MIAVAAAVLRLWDLGSLPVGLHGDEAIWGMEADRILDDGSIGIYTRSALGQPTAPFYLGAIVIGLFGSSVWAIRLPAALAGVVTVVVLHRLVERRFGRAVALAAAAALAAMVWSLHFSRIAFGLAWWPLVVTATIAAFDRAATSSDPRWWIGAGALAASGVYVYNSHWVFGLAIVLYLLAWAPRQWRRGHREKLPPMLFAIPAALVVLAPMLVFAADSTNDYFDHFDSASRRNSADWIDASPPGKVGLLVEWYAQAWNRLLFDSEIDWVDASGVIAPVPLIFTMLAVIGLVEAVRRHRTPFVGLMLATLLVLPLGPALTINGFTRRAYAMAPIVAFLAGLGAVVLIDAVRRRVHPRVASVTGAALVTIVVFTSIVPYFTTFRESNAQRWVFVEELAVSVDVIAEANAEVPVFVNWFSARHRWDYETIEYLLGDTPGATRVPLVDVVDAPGLGLRRSTGRDQLFVLIGAYAAQLGELERLYPNGTVLADRTDPRVVAYRVPAGPAG